MTDWTKTLSRFDVTLLCLQYILTYEKHNRCVFYYSLNESFSSIKVERTRRKKSSSPFIPQNRKYNLRWQIVWRRIISYHVWPFLTLWMRPKTEAQMFSSGYLQVHTQTQDFSFYIMNETHCCLLLLMLLYFQALLQ